MNIELRALAWLVSVVCCAGLLGCACCGKEAGDRNAPPESARAGDQRVGAESPDREPPARAATAEPPPAIRAWMDRLTVEHDYDPTTGFIVARETIILPPVIADAPPLDEAVRRASAEGRLVIAFATADRCAPCQQYKKDAMNDPRVIARLADPRLLATHVEVDRQGELADRYLGGRGIPMTYALRDGQRVGVLRGQKSAEELLAWLDEVLAG